MIQIVVNNVYSKIKNLCDIRIIDIIDKQTSFYVEGYQYTRAFKNGYFDKKTGVFKNWDGKRRLLTRTLCFPTGLLTRVKDILKNNGQKYQIIDKRPIIKHNNPIKINHYIPRPYQLEALQSAIKNERGILRLATGSGKTVLAGLIIAHYNLPSMIYVIGKDLLYQFHQEMEKCLGIKVGFIGDGIYNIKRINVCSIWTAIKSFNLKQNVSLDDEDWSPEIISVNSEQKRSIKMAIENTNLSIFDEAHFLATDTLQSIYKVSKNCRYLFGLSGTDWRDDQADLLLESICGKRIYNLPASKLIEDNFLVQPKIVLLETPPYHENIPKNYQSIYSKYIVNNDIRNGMIEDSARALLAKGRRVLILVKYLNHGKILAEKLSDISLFFVNGKVDGQTREEVKKDLQSGKLKCVISSSVFDIGVDLPSLDALILGGGGKSTVRAMQRVGRVIRPFKNKKFAIVVDFYDNAEYLIKHSAVRVAMYSTEDKFTLKFPKEFDHEKLKKPRWLEKRIKTQVRDM